MSLADDLVHACDEFQAAVGATPNRVRCRIGSPAYNAIMSGKFNDAIDPSELPVYVDGLRIHGVAEFRLKPRWPT